MEAMWKVMVWATISSILVVKLQGDGSYSNKFNVAKCNLGEVKLEPIGLRLSPIAVRDMRGGPLGSCRASLGTCS